MIFYDQSTVRKRNAIEKRLQDAWAEQYKTPAHTDPKENTLQILMDGVKAVDASKFPVDSVGCPPGIVLVEMLPESDRVGSILLPDVVAGKLRPDVAVVLATGPNCSLPVGTLVAVRPYDGQWIEGFDIPGYSTKNQVRVIGRYVPAAGEIEPLDWDETIPLTFVGNEFDMVASGRNIIIQRDPQIEEDHGIILPDKARHRSGLATVLSIGPQCDLLTRVGPIEVGDRICYSPEGLLNVEFAGSPDMAIISDLCVSFVMK
jgi:co-chaperonin GroES (HSP10)